MATEGELGLDIITELRLGLPGDSAKSEKKRVYAEIVKDVHDHHDDDEEGNNDIDNRKNERRIIMKSSEKKNGDDRDQDQAVVVGWPPVGSYRRKNSFGDRKVYVKVSMDGAPFLRKIDLTVHKGYPHLALALEKLFACFGIGESFKDGDSCEFSPIYEDKDGDWMLVGDVPWEMFVESCKRLRIMKKSDAMGFGLEPKSFVLKGTSLRNENK